MGTFKLISRQLYDHALVKKTKARKQKQRILQNTTWISKTKYLLTQVSLT